MLRPDPLHSLLSYTHCASYLQPSCAASELHRLEARWRDALEASGLAVWDNNIAADDYYCSPAWYQMRGYDPENNIDLSLDVWIETVHPDDRELVLHSINQQRQGKLKYSQFEYRERHAAGHWIWIESRGSVVEYADDGNPSRIIGTDTDVSARKADQAKLCEVSRRLQLALQVSGIGVFEANLETGEVVRDERLQEIYGYPAALDPTGSLLSQCLHIDDREKALAAVAAGTASCLPFDNEFRIHTGYGTIRHIKARSMKFVDDSGQKKLIGVNWDVTDDRILRDELEEAKRLAECRSAELEAAKHALQEIAYRDHLTGLFNRRALDGAMSDWQGSRCDYIAILHFDLDRFKEINDAYGHRFGDLTLRHASSVLRNVFDDADFVARAGGDEFVVLLSIRRTSEDAMRLAKRAVEALAAPVVFDEAVCQPRASVGVALRDNEANPSQLLSNADFSLRHAKKLGRGQAVLFDEALQKQSREVRSLTLDLKQGLLRGEFIPYYQPQFRASDMQLCGVEVLARWQRPDGQTWSPAAFMPVAEDAALLVTLDTQITRAALADMREWLRCGINIPRMSFNLSMERLRSTELVGEFLAAEVPLERLALELLETVSLDEFDATRERNLAQLRALGAEIEIDDFGTGHASISGLLRLSPDRLKIDRSIVIPAVNNDKQRSVIKSIVEIGKHLNVQVVAEGVETQEHIQLCQELECDVLQGYALAKPLSKATFETLFSEGTRVSTEVVPLGETAWRLG